MANIPKTGGAVVRGASGGPEREGQVAVDPDAWVITLFRALKNYVLTNTDEDIYDIRFDFPNTVDLGEFMPLDKTVIHFEIDDIQNPPIGFGENILQVDRDEDTEQIVEHEAKQHRVEFDVGIWASTKSGGVTARLKAYQLLNDLFVGAQAYRNMLDITGIEVRNFSGGNFIKEEISDIDVFRVMNMNLTVHIFSRRTKGPAPFIVEVLEDPSLTTSDGLEIDA
jgi:hypothetical protein